MLPDTDYDNPAVDLLIAAHDAADETMKYGAPAVHGAITAIGVIRSAGYDLVPAATVETAALYRRAIERHLWASKSRDAGRPIDKTDHALWHTLAVVDEMRVQR